jgi:hypothetical protein
MSAASAGLMFRAIFGAALLSASLVHLLRGDMDWTNAYMVTISVALLATGGAFVAKALWSKRFSAEPATTVQAG